MCCAGRSAPSQSEMVTGLGFSSSNQADQERTTACRDSSGPGWISDAHCATIFSDWEGPSGESRLINLSQSGGTLQYCPRKWPRKCLSPEIRKSVRIHLTEGRGVSWHGGLKRHNPGSGIKYCQNRFCFPTQALGLYTQIYLNLSPEEVIREFNEKW